MQGIMAPCTIIAAVEKPWLGPTPGRSEGCPFVASMSLGRPDLFDVTCLIGVQITMLRPGAVRMPPYGQSDAESAPACQYQEKSLPHNVTRQSLSFPSDHWTDCPPTGW